MNREMLGVYTFFIGEWYEKTQHPNLEYLNLAKEPKPATSSLANNLEVIHNQVCLLSKVSLKHFYLLKEENKLLREEIVKLRTAVSLLESESLKNPPVTKRELKAIIAESSEQPKIVTITKELKREVKEVERILQEVKKLIGE